jgi:DNA processing protein
MPPIESSRTATDVHELSLSDEHYPNRLRELSDAPKLLYVRGDDELLARERLVAVIGTREPTVFGISPAVSVSRRAAGAGGVFAVL